MSHKARGKWLKCSIIKQSQQLDEYSNLPLFFDNLKLTPVECSDDFELIRFWIKT